MTPRPGLPSETGGAARARPFLLRRTAIGGALLGASLLLAGLSVAAADRGAGAALAAPGAAAPWQSLMEFPNPEGRVGVVLEGEPVDPATHPFFQPIGPYGRACASCHRPADAMSLSLRTIRGEWDRQGAASPLFAAYDGSNCPSLPQGDAKSHSILLSRGAFRIALPWPPKRLDGTTVEPNFSLRVINDPTGCNLDPLYGLDSNDPRVSVFRRPRMTANLRYILNVMHERNGKTQAPLDRDPETGALVSMSLLSDARLPTLKTQADDALTQHMGLTAPLDRALLDQIVDFERRVYVAQNHSSRAGPLPGGPRALGAEAMRRERHGLNGNDRDTGVFFNFDEWAAQPGSDGREGDAGAAFRASVARGNDIFFNRPFWISDVVGINTIRLGNPYKQTCAFCHNTQMTGHDDVPGWMDLGTVNFPRSRPSPDLPTFEIVCKPNAAPHPYLGRRIYTSDPGRALVTGKCEDVGGLVMQQFRGMAAREPYFANGSAATIREVVEFYDQRFNIGYTEQEKTDLTNFLSVL